MNDWRLGIEALGGVLITLLTAWIAYQKWLRPMLNKETAAERKFRLDLVDKEEKTAKEHDARVISQYEGVIAVLKENWQHDKDDWRAQGKELRSQLDTVIAKVVDAHTESVRSQEEIGTLRAKLATEQEEMRKLAHEHRRCLDDYNQLQARVATLEAERNHA